MLENAGISAGDGQRLAYIVMAAELDAIVCSSPRRGKQFTYALLDERAPGARVLTREEGREELARRYFASRGPATARDFAKWSGLTLSDARAALEAIGSDLERETSGDEVYWFPRQACAPSGGTSTAHLLSIYDEYISSYKGRGAIVDSASADRLIGMGNALSYVLLVDGRIVGTWNRTIESRGVLLEVEPFRPLPKRSIRAVEAAARRYGRFLGLPVAVSA